MEADSRSVSELVYPLARRLIPQKCSSTSGARPGGRNNSSNWTPPAREFPAVTAAQALHSIQTCGAELY